jgi:hypothetical protein
MAAGLFSRKTGDGRMRRLPMTLVLVGIALLLRPLAAAAERQPGDCGYYSNRYGDAIARHCGSTMHAPPPQRVTAMCRDGSYSYDQGRDACFVHGGVQIWQR